MFLQWGAQSGLRNRRLSAAVLPQSGPRSHNYKVAKPAAEAFSPVFLTLCGIIRLVTDPRGELNPSNEQAHHSAAAGVSVTTSLPFPPLHQHHSQACFRERGLTDGWPPLPLSLHLSNDGPWRISLPDERYSSPSIYT